MLRRQLVPGLDNPASARSTQAHRAATTLQHQLQQCLSQSRDPGIDGDLDLLISQMDDLVFEL